jgi:rod shape-determining protein MreC
LRRTRSSAAILALPLKPLLARLFTGFLFGMAVLLMTLTQKDSEFIHRIRMTMADTMVPVINVVSAPMESMKSGWQTFQNHLAVYEENERLRAENANLRRWQHYAQAVMVENRSYAQLLKALPPATAKTYTTRLLHDHASPFARSAFIMAGKQDGVKKYQAVVSKDGLIGRVIETGRHSSRLLLVTDLNSRIPVVGMQSGEKALAIGNNGDKMQLSYIRENSNLKPGEILVTSGDDGVLPYGLRVGVVESVGDKVITVLPAANSDQTQMITVLTEGGARAVVPPQLSAPDVAMPAKRADVSPAAAGNRATR